MGANEMGDKAPRAAIALFRHSKTLQILSALAALIAIPAFLISLPPVQGWLFNNRPEIEVALLSKIPVFDVRRPTPGLTVLYNNRDLTAARRALVSVRLRIRNVGGTSLTPADVSPRDPLGFVVRHGQIIRLNGLEANSDHLRRFAAPRIQGQIVTLSDGLIMDPGQYIEFDLLILKSANSDIRIQPIGKVSRQPSIQLVDVATQGDQPGLLQRTFAGGFLEHLIRLVAYFIVGVGLLILVGFAIDKIYVARTRRIAKSRDRIALAALDSVAGYSPTTVAVALGIFSFVGQDAFEFVIHEFNEKYTRSINVGPAYAQTQASPIPVDANRHAVFEHLTSDYIMDFSSISLLVRSFGLINGEEVSEEFMRVMDKIAETGRKLDAQQFGTGIVSYARENFTMRA